MLCPVCRTVDLMMTERQGIEIDYCPTCRGVWLDRGELDKILERSAGLKQARIDEPRKQREDVPVQYRYDDERYDDDDRYHQKRKNSWLGDVFDIFD